MTPDEIIEAEFEEVGSDAQPEGRALVATAPPSARPNASGLPFSFRADASFVAQLIAAAANAPQTRGLRRASTDDALASYRGTVTREQTVAPAGTTTSRTV
jgi:hypothetical protein